MKLSLNWLKDYVSISAPVEQLAHRLTMAGLEVEKMTEAGGDTVFELEITPNRPDCLNVVGIAREAAAIFNKNLKIPKIKKISFAKNKTEIAIQEKDLCPRYIGTVMRAVKVGPSPAWLKERLEAIGLRSINNVVDITNFCLLELGQPLHAFDYDQLAGGMIVVRRAKPGESIMTIDGGEQKLDPSILVIADEKRPVAIAGIMGGKATEVTTETKNILLESAYFDPIVIRRAGRKLGLSSDSSYRFERGVPLDIVEPGAQRAIALIQQIAGGTITAFADVYPGKKKNLKSEIKISLAEINSLLGADIAANRIQGVLKKLEFKATVSKNNFKITPPLFRNDVRSRVDVIEEVARIVGYDTLPSSTPNIKMSLIQPHSGWICKNHLRTLLTAQGLSEIITYSLVSPKDLEKIHLEDRRGIHVKNPLNEDQAMLRPDLLASFLSVLFFNISRGQKDVQIFELGKVYPALPEKEVLGILLTGTRHEDWRQMNKESVDFYDLKGRLESIFNEYDIKQISFDSIQHAAFENHHAVAVKIKNHPVGILGKIARDVLEAWDIKRAQVFFAQMDIAWLYEYAGAEKRYQLISEFPAIVRDASLAIKKDVSWRQILGMIEQATSPKGIFVSLIKFQEEYKGEKIPEGYRGIVFSLTYRTDPPRTLRDEEVNEIHNQICSLLKEKLGAIVR